MSGYQETHLVQLGVLRLRLLENGNFRVGVLPEAGTPRLQLCLAVLILLVTMVYGPLSAALVETFPTRIRYTALSVPYHVGVGWIGGLLPTVAFSLVVATGTIYYGLWCPVLIASLSFLIGLRYVQETRGRDIHAE